MILALVLLDPVDHKHIRSIGQVGQWLLVDSGSQISAVTWTRTVHENRVADAFCSKKSISALLVHEQQAAI